MLVTLELPDEVAKEIQATTTDLPKHILEGFARQSYRSGRLTASQVRDLLHFHSQEEIDALLQCPDDDSRSGLEGGERYPLRGTTPYSYEDPFEPAIPWEEWEANA